jgi:ABC transporter DrrB family efflux protein
MSAAVSITPAGPARAAWTTSVASWCRHVWTLTRRNFVHVMREPAQLSDATIQPVLFTVLFVYIFGSAMQITGGSYVDFAVGGLVVMNLSTAAIGTAVGLSSDLTTGVIDRFRTLPMVRSTILFGRTLADLFASVLCSTIVVVTGYVIGWRPDNGLPGVIAGLGVAVAFAYALSWFTAWIGLRSKGPESAQAVGLLILFPVAFVSSCFVPTSGLPDWLRPIADWNPVSAVAGATRVLFGNPNPNGFVHNFPNQHPVVMSLLWTAAILAVCVPLASRTLRARTVD